MAVLDTCFLIDVLHNFKPAIEVLHNIENHENLCIASPTVMELWEGALKSKIPESEKKKVNEIIAGLEILDFDLSAAKQAAEITTALLHNPIEVTDAIIAGISKAHGETVVTRDAHFARIPGLRVLKY